MSHVTCFLLGFSCGALALWYYFDRVKLIRSRAEWNVIHMEACRHPKWEPGCLACEAWADYCEEQGRSFEETWPGEERWVGQAEQE